MTASDITEQRIKQINERFRDIARDLKRQLDALEREASAEVADPQVLLRHLEQIEAKAHQAAQVLNAVKTAPPEGASYKSKLDRLYQRL